MRFVYVDESGTSQQETILVVAGIIIHADSQWVPVAKHVRELRDKYVHEEDRQGFFFHAKDIFSGTGKVWGNRIKYSLAHRCEVLKEVLAIPARFRLPVVFGFIRKETIRPERGKEDRRKAIANDHALAFSMCAIGAEKFLKDYAGADEIAKMVAEDNTDTKKRASSLCMIFSVVGTLRRQNIWCAGLKI